MSLSSPSNLFVPIAIGQTLYIEGCEWVSLQIQGNPYITDFYILLTLGGCDAVLGIQWLQTLGPILWDFDRLFMEFSYIGQKCTLQGISNSGLSLMEGEEFGKPTQPNHKGVSSSLHWPNSANVHFLYYWPTNSIFG